MRLFESEIVARSIFLLAVAIVVSALFVVQVTGGHNMAATNSGLARIDLQSTPTSGNITLSVPTQQRVQVGALLTFTANATDPDNATRLIYLSASGLPFGATFPIASGNPISATFSWGPTSTQGPGNYTVTFQASYSQNSSLVTSMVLIEVLKANKPLPPVLTLPGPQTINPGTLLSFAIVAVDPNLPPSQVNVTVAGLPRGSSYDPSANIFSWKPTDDQAPGVYILIFSARDTNGVVGSKVTISVVKSSPVFSLPQSSVDYLAFTSWAPLLALVVAALYIVRLKRREKTDSRKFAGREIEDGANTDTERISPFSNPSSQPIPGKK